MPWSTPTLQVVRTNNRDYITAKLGVPLIPNDYPRVLADANAGNAHLNLQYIDWLALQLLPDTAETQFLDKWANIYLTNSDGSKGRKVATYASGTATITGTLALGASMPQGTQFTAQSGSDTLTFQTTSNVTVANAPTQFEIRSLQAGAESNLAVGSVLTISAAIPGIDGSTAAVVSMSGGADEETDDDLRIRVLTRIQQPPMGGDAEDYVEWALEYPGVTRAWASPMEMGVGTMTVRFMMDDLRATTSPLTNGFPLPGDCAGLLAFLNTKRPVTVKDLFVVAPVPELINFTVSNLDSDDSSTWANIATSVSAMLAQKAAPAYAQNGVAQEAQTIYAAWVSDAILNAEGVTSFDLTMTDHAMPTAGSMAVLGSITHG
jgi:uncharacterized phage protein gp47/JayE